MLIMWRRLLCCLLLIAFASCHAESVEKQFFKEGFVSRVERLERYSLEDQWRIFLYGNQVVHPPLTDLALPLAERGKPALDYILQQLEQSKSDLDFRDSLVVFRRMRGGGYYNVCGDASAMQAIKGNESKVRNPGWRDVYGQMLRDLCKETERESSQP
jgi:hypothetical protein